MKELTREYVLHVAHLGRLELSDEEIEKYRFQLKQILDEINKIKEININEEDILISPSDNYNVFSDYEYKDIDTNKILNNSVKKDGNYIEVRWLKNE